MINTSIKTLIFDLGGVILNLSVQRTYEAFSRLSGLSLERVTDLAKSKNEFLLYEKGMISSAEFREFIRQSMEIQASDQEIDLAWNAMLLNIPLERLRILKKLRTRYGVFLLSNTNEIHLNAFSTTLLKASGGYRFNSYFDKEYYSHNMAMRKPDAAIYEFVITDNSLLAEQTLFFDDTPLNLDGAKRVGLQTFHVTNADELFKELGKLK